MEFFPFCSKIYVEIKGRKAKLGGQITRADFMIYITVHSLGFIPELCQNSDFKIILNLVLPDTFASNNKIV